MKILLDTNVLLDVALRREAFFTSSAETLEWAEAHPKLATVAWHSLSTIAYLLKPSPRKFIQDLLEFVNVPSVGHDDALLALRMPIEDFEDSLQAATAIACNADFIITRDIADFRKSPIPAIEPSDFLRRCTTVRRIRRRDH